MILIKDSQLEFDIMKILSGKQLTRKEIFNSTDNYYYTLVEIKTELADIRRYGGNICANKIKNTNHYFLDRNNYYFIDGTAIKMKKEKNILTIELDSNNSIKYDFLTEKMNFIGNNDIIYCIYIPREEKSFKEFVLRNLLEEEKVSTPEWIFSYLDIIDFTKIDSNFYRWNRHLPKECKKGYMQFVQEHRLEISGYTAQLFEWYQNIQVSYVEIKLFYDVLSFGYLERSQYDKVREYLYNNSEIISDFYKAYVTTAKNGEIFPNYHDLVYMLITIMIKQYNFKIDSNRTLNYNIKNFNEFKNSVNQQRIKKQQSRIVSLDNQEIDNYIIKVPQSTADLVDEGRQQNNCVGSFYNESIMTGKDLIYFIREKNNPKKSFVTCRYSIAYNETVEHKYKNNKNEEALRDVRTEIDNLIRKLLSM